MTERLARLARHVRESAAFAREHKKALYAAAVALLAVVSHVTDGVPVEAIEVALKTILAV